MLWSPVTRTAKAPEARRSNSPFLTPDQPRRGTVWTSWLGKWAANGRGTDSSRRTRTVRHEAFRQLENRDGLIPADGRKGVEKRVHTVTRGEVLEQDAYGHPCPDEHGGSAKDFRISVDGGGSLVHGSSPLGSAYPKKRCV